MFERTFSSAAAVLIACGASHAATRVKQSAGPTQQTLAVSDTASQQASRLCSDGWDNVPGASVQVTIPSGPNQLLTARFEGAMEIGPSGETGGIFRIVTGSKELLPVSQFYLVTPNDGAYPVERGLERSGIVAGGTTRYVTVQYCAVGGAESVLTVRDWHLTVEAAPVQ